MENVPNRKRSHGLGIGVLAVATVLLLGLGAWRLNSTGSTDSQAATPIATAASPSPAGPRLIIDAVGLNVPLSAMMVDNRTVNPPGNDAAYILANHGYPPSHTSEGTVYIAMHALHTGSGAPGNLLADTTTRQPRLTEGDTITADGTTYTVTNTYTADKTTVANDTNLWNPTITHRLVILTCLPNTSGHGTASHNIITIAQHDLND